MVRRQAVSVSLLGRLGSAIVLLIAFGTCEVFAQTATGNIVGVIKDTTGALIPGVNISVKHPIAVTSARQ